MLGRFLEFAVPTPDIRASLDFYRRLGFSQAQVGDTWSHPYAVVTDGRIHIGLHQDPAAAAALTFVKPALLSFLDALEPLGVELLVRRLGADVFNELGWADPCGMRVKLIEARTFSPSKRRPVDVSACGYFSEIGLPCAAPADGKDFWERLGFVGMEEPDAPLPHVSCTSDTIDLGLYEPALLREPTLLFQTGDVRGVLARLARDGIEPSGRLPAALRGGPAALLIAPEGTALLLLGDEAA